MCDGLLEAAPRTGAFDLVRDYALPIPLTVISELLGIPKDERQRFHRLTQGALPISVASGVLDIPMALPYGWLIMRYFRRLFAERRARPGDDLLSALVQAEEVGDRLDEDELLGIANLLLVAGYETTVHLIGSAARGNTGDNPWVGCVIVNGRGDVLGVEHTLGPGEAHTEVAAALDAQARGHSVIGATLYSTLEPCSFHGRTPACAVSIASRGIATVVTVMRDPHPRVNGAGVAILRSAGVHVIERVCETEVMRQLGHWVLSRHPHENADPGAAASRGPAG